MVTIKGGQRVELSWRRLRKFFANISHTSSSWPIPSACTDAAKDTPSTPAPTYGKEHNFDQRDYDIPIPSQKSIPDDFQRNVSDNVKYDKLATRKLHQTPFLLLAKQTKVSRRIATYLSLYQTAIPDNYICDNEVEKNAKLVPRTLHAH